MSKFIHILLKNQEYFEKERKMWRGFVIVLLIKSISSHLKEWISIQFYAKWRRSPRKCIEWDWKIVIALLLKLREQFLKIDSITFCHVIDSWPFHRCGHVDYHKSYPITFSVYNAIKNWNGIRARQSQYICYFNSISVWACRCDYQFINFFNDKLKLLQNCTMLITNCMTYFCSSL